MVIDTVLHIPGDGYLSLKTPVCVQKHHIIQRNVCTDAPYFMYWTETEASVELDDEEEEEEEKILDGFSKISFVWRLKSKTNESEHSVPCISNS